MSDTDYTKGMQKLGLDPDWPDLRNYPAVAWRVLEAGKVGIARDPLKTTNNWYGWIYGDGRDFYENTPADALYAAVEALGREECP